MNLFDLVHYNSYKIEKAINVKPNNYRLNVLNIFAVFRIVTVLFNSVVTRYNMVIFTTNVCMVLNIFLLVTCGILLFIFCSICC